MKLEFILMCLFPVKLPQIIKILIAKSGEGINMTSVLLELLAITGNVAYGFAQGYPFR
jgi:mannose-P-dolichol utilization defect protein 1